MKDEVYLVGHKNPDLDSTASAIAYAFLKKKKDPFINYIPVIQGEPNAETKFVLDECNIQTPIIRNNFNLTVGDILIDNPIFAYEDESIYEVIKRMIKNHANHMPVLKSNEVYEGNIGLKFLAKRIITNAFTGDLNKVNIKTQKINSLLNPIYSKVSSQRVKGKITIGDFEECSEEISEEVIIITSLNKKLIECIKKKPENVNTLIITKIIRKDEYLRSVEEDLENLNINLIVTSKNTLNTAQILQQSKQIKEYIKKDVKICESEDKLNYIKNEIFEEKLIPVVNNSKLKGIVTKNSFYNMRKNKIILLDHSEKSQTISGLEDCEIIEIIDHHKLGDITTSKPIFVKQEPVGSTCTIVAREFFRENVPIPQDIRKLLISGILSDTVIFTSPTTTKIDIETVERLNENVQLDLKSYGKEIFAANENVVTGKARDLLLLDQKDFEIDGLKIGIAQLQLIDTSKIIDRKEEIQEEIKKLQKEKKFNTFILMVTDILNKNSKLIYETKSNELKRTLKKDFPDGYVNFMSRKKELFPYLNELLE